MASRAILGWADAKTTPCLRAQAGAGTRGRRCAALSAKHLRSAGSEAAALAWIGPGPRRLKLRFSTPKAASPRNVLWPTFGSVDGKGEDVRAGVVACDVEVPLHPAKEIGVDVGEEYSLLVVKGAGEDSAFGVDDH